MRLSVSLLVLCISTAATWSDTLGEVRQALQHQQSLRNNHCLTYQLDYTIEWKGDSPQRYPHRGGRFQVMFCRSGDLSKISFKRLRAVGSTPQQLGEKYPYLLDIAEWEYWYGNNWMALLSNTAAEGNIVTIFPCQSNGVFCSMYRIGQDYDMTRFDAAILGGFSLLEAPDIRWSVVRKDSQQVTLLGEYEAQAQAKGIVQIELSYPEIRLNRVVMRESIQQGDRVRMMYEKSWRIQTSKGKDKLPDKINIISNMSFATIRATIKLLDSRLLQSELPLNARLHTPVNDYRLIEYQDLLSQVTIHADDVRRQVVRYPWIGRMYTTEELKQLAYQQGNLIPPETPRRRFSPLLFVPAVIFFTLAAYLYFKNRRR